MSDPNFFMLYVDSPVRSARFYATLLGKQPVEESPTFAMFALSSGVMLGLWSKHTVEPGARHTGGGCELAFTMDSTSRVDEMHAELRDRGLPILQSPVNLDFGYTFVALDPDEHRLRVWTPAT